MRSLVFERDEQEPYQTFVVYNLQWERKPMRILIDIIPVWLGLNLAISALIVWQRSPHFRHRMFRLTSGAFAPKQTHLAHALAHRPHFRPQCVSADVVCEHVEPDSLELGTHLRRASHRPRM